MNRYVPSARGKDMPDPPDAIGRVLGVLRNGWLIGMVAVSVTALGTWHALRSTPVYEGSTVIQIKRNPALAIDAGDSSAATEMEILRSRSVLQPVAQHLQLDIRLDPRPLPLSTLVRSAFLDAAAGSGPWPSAAQVHVTRFDVPPALFGSPFELALDPDGTYTVADAAHGIRFGGKAGTPVRADSRYGPIALLVASANVPPGARLRLRSIPVAQAVDQLQHALVVSENGKLSNVIRLTLQGSDPRLISRILGAIVDEYLRQRDREQAAAAGRLLASYDGQLEASRAALHSVDAHYARLLQRSGIVDAEAEAQSLVQQSNALELQLAEAQQRKAELASRLGDGHPAMDAVNRQVADLARSLGRNAARRATLSQAGRELADVVRDKQALGDGTLALFNQRSKLEAMIAAQRDEVRLLDRAETPLRTITPTVSTMALLSAFGGLCLGLLASIVKNAIVARRQSRLLGASRFRLVALARADSTRGS